jgi:kynureninase
MQHDTVSHSSLAYAKSLDIKDPLKKFRNYFHFPKHTDGSDIIYFCGNSLGLQPKNYLNHINEVLEAWKTKGVEGHFEGENAWIPYLDHIVPPMAEIVGALPSEVTVMNGLTVNLHLMMVSFYQPTKNRNKILMDYSPFPSDQYTVQSQVRFHGFDSEESVIELEPNNGEEVSWSQIEKVLKEQGESIELILIGGINYYTGQLYNIQKITELGHKYGCKVGFDLAHAAGNVDLSLHNDGPDFAVWCTYKYMNSGPGNLSGCFVHERHRFNPDLPRFAGWWGNDQETRFLMEKNFVPQNGAEGWVISNPPILSLAGIRASMDIFNEAGFSNLLEKSRKLTGYLEELILSKKNDKINIITPSNPSNRGCQLSLQVKNADHSLFDRLRENGVIGDWREPDVIRVAPVPLYNTFEEVFRFAEILDHCIHH